MNSPAPACTEQTAAPKDFRKRVIIKNTPTVAVLDVLDTVKSSMAKQILSEVI
jgi:hypothetical protein